MNRKFTTCLLFLGFGFTGFAQNKYVDGLNNIIAAENGFAKTALDFNVKRAFLNNLDSTGVVFNGPVAKNGIAVYSKAPENNTNLLAWYPAVADVAPSGEMGFTSGPFTYSQKRGEKPVACGYYFTIWKKDKAGVFKVLFDGGVGHPCNDTLFKPEPKLENASRLKLKPASINAADIDFRTAENDFCKIAANDAAKAYQGALHEGAWLLRSNTAAQKDKQGGLAAIKKEQVTGYQFTEVGYGVAISKNFAYAYGAVKVTLPGIDEKPEGFYVRVWKFDGLKWIIIADEVSYNKKV